MSANCDSIQLLKLFAKLEFQTSTDAWYMHPALPCVPIDASFAISVDDASQQKIKHVRSDCWSVVRTPALTIFLHLSIDRRKRARTSN